MTMQRHRAGALSATHVPERTRRIARAHASLAARSEHGASVFCANTPSRVSASKSAGVGRLCAFTSGARCAMEVPWPLIAPVRRPSTDVREGR